VKNVRNSFIEAVLA